MPAFFISLREGLEAALIAGILFGTLRRLGQQHLARYVWLGIISAAALSAVVALALTAAGLSFEGRSEEIFEGIMLISAAALLTGMIFWMQRKGSEVRAALEAETRRAAGTEAKGIFPGGAWALFAIAFVAVMREGIELALLLVATTFEASALGAITAAALGIGSAALLGVLMYMGVVKLDVRQFFRVTNVLLLLFAAGMVGLGVHEFIEAGLLPAIVDPVWNINSLISDSSGVGELLKGLFGYNGNPALTEILAYSAYILLTGWALTRIRRPMAARA